MINSAEVYFDCGYKAGLATRNRDAAMARVQREWFVRAKALETGADKDVAEQEYKRGYADAQPSHLLR